jgi:hypothetical protein
VVTPPDADAAEGGASRGWNRSDGNATPFTVGWKYQIHLVLLPLKYG